LASGPLLLELTLSLLASSALLPELLLCCDDRGGLVGEVGLQFLGCRCFRPATY
jgi:hypothetical protein